MTMRFPFFRKKQAEQIPYDPARREPAVRRSICTGEMTGGFIERETGQFQDLCLLDGREAFEDFCRSVGKTPEEVRTIY